MSTGKIILLVGIGWLVLQEFMGGAGGVGTAAPAQAGAGTGTGTGAQPATPAPQPSATTHPAPSGVAYAPPTVTAQLVTLAGVGASGVLNADQWNYYLAKVPGQGALQDPVFSSIFWPQGRPVGANGVIDMSLAPKMTAAQFVAAAQSGGVTGLSGVGMAKPVVELRRAPSASNWTM